MTPSPRAAAAAEANSVPDHGGPSVIGRAISIVRAFDQRTQILGISEISRRTGLPKATASRMAKELAAHRVLERSPKGGYRLGLFLFEVGALVPAHHSIASVARPVMVDLRDTTKGRIHLAVLDGTEVVYVEIVGEARTPIASRVGGRLPAHATGVGKVILAHCAASVVDQVINTGLPRLTPRTLHTPGALLRDLEAIRTEGQGYDREESTLGISCVAAPIFDSDGQVLAGISITGPTRTIDPDRMGLAIRTAARTITRQVRSSYS